MLKEVIWPDDQSYLSGSSWEPYQFYNDALKNSNRLELLLGYFSSSAINALSESFAQFIHGGGVVHMIINDILSSSDKAAVIEGQNFGEHLSVFDLSDISQLAQTLQGYDRHFFECLAWLISQDRIVLKIVRPKDGKGISHFKSGVFYDGQEKVGFKASCNFTSYGLLENLEELDIYLSWENGRSGTFIKKRIDYFKQIFTGKADFVEYLDATQIKEALQNNFGGKDEEELLIQEKELQAQKKRFRKRHTKVKDNSIAKSEPQFPYSEGPRPYQEEAYTNWVKHNKKGLFAMATGTGKTLTSLNCLLHEYQDSGKYRAIILVPTIELVTQWKKECQKFTFQNIITVSSKERWDNNIAFINLASRFISSSFIIITTYASFHRKKFQEYFRQLPIDTLLIADEAHNLGSPLLTKLLPSIHLEKRIGLSATPDRQYDTLGNLALEQFFNDAPPFVYSYTMEMALKSEWLCPYAYYPHVVYLTTEETDQYMKLSRQLLTYFDQKTKSYQKCPEVDFLLLARKRLVHKATNKKQVFEQIVNNEFDRKGSLKYTLVYVPEGLNDGQGDDDHDIHVFDDQDEFQESTDELSLIDQYTKIIRSVDPRIMVKQYTAKTGDRPQTIKDFQEGKIHVLTSMKCLDEGVDVPRSELAIFCASTGNPRQFVQRRGRVLRLHKEKAFAVIHDLVVVPQVSEDDSTYAMERSFIQKELLRVVDFSVLSDNKSDTYKELRSILEYYNLNLNDLANL
ncbi:DEAD/DEAH box helicase family protein [Mucilaginibacter litoreus]|uniref:DEAD/DEAH box helicase family protein n=1 Tax=Mucilaginibacter litoreus TaxID=1048221 RepID=A0ABW3AP90_9SPHI